MILKCARNTRQLKSNQASQDCTSNNDDGYVQNMKYERYNTCTSRLAIITVCQLLKQLLIATIYLYATKPFPNPDPSPPIF